MTERCSSASGSLATPDLWHLMHASTVDQTPRFAGHKTARRMTGCGSCWSICIEFMPGTRCVDLARSWCLRWSGRSYRLL